ncbi:DUF202 domain-containing protein [Aridibaculum aurantiacum]|uniref:DUF202 domain-containing protein n=1 Tax=Aridibaculum aurantiacum TaxID=2810307 RepID=UPI001A96F106|nr:DUF202 domain-containing protein [Aridibaculum aurantiacum]
MEQQKVNKDLILREKLALQRTVMANQRTFLSFIRTSLYFSIAGFSVGEILVVKHEDIIGFAFFGLSIILLIIGFYSYYVQRKKIEASRQHIGNYLLEYEEDV